MGDQRMLPVNGVELCVETFGDPADPAILLIGGAAAAMDWWEDEFCARLAAGLRFVIRYDHRDTGQSTSCPAGKPNYGLDDLAKDAVGLLDVLEIDRAHVVAVSMGGMIGQRLALDHPNRVASLTAMSTSPGGPGGPDNPDLPPARVRDLAGRIADRTIDMEASQTNHFVMDSGASTRPRLGQIAAPTLVIHGTEDPLFQYGHAEALAREIAGAELLPLKGFGHQMPPPDTWDTVVPAILRHTSGGWDEQAARLFARSHDRRPL
jgi:pimeloyl-ACP methyl ester carboxylesterase